jgi:ectoine hydroxylase-related dioxygenase (phytanoyl-CoA dioxygenase family)
MAILTPADHAFFTANGYLVVRDIVPKTNCDAVIDAIFAFLEMDRNNPEDWYRAPHRTNGMVEIYHDQALWDNRQHSNMHQVFSEIYGTEKLLVSEDRAGFKPPQHPAHPEYADKGFVHWDTDTRVWPQHFQVQAVLSLADTTPDMGGFQCVPGFHKDLDKWIATQPADRSPYMPDLAALPVGMAVTPIPMRAGDLVIWDTLLAHGNGHNVSNRPRLAQYITMFPAERFTADDIAARIDRFDRRVPPPNARAFPGDPRQRETLLGKPPQLTALGRKLLGADAWA